MCKCQKSISRLNKSTIIAFTLREIICRGGGEDRADKNWTPSQKQAYLWKQYFGQEVPFSPHMVGWPWPTARWPPGCCLQCSSSARQGERIRRKSSWVKIKTGRSFTSYCHGQNRLALREKNLLPIKIDLNCKKQRQKLKQYLLPTLFFQAQLHSYILKSSTSPVPWGVGNGCSQPVTDRLCLSVSPSSSHFSPAPESVLSTDYCPSDKLASAWALHGLQFLQKISSCSGMGVLHGLQCGHPLHHGPFHRLQVNTCSPEVSP